MYRGWACWAKARLTSDTITTARIKVKNRVICFSRNCRAVWSWPAIPPARLFPDFALSQPIEANLVNFLTHCDQIWKPDSGLTCNCRTVRCSNDQANSLNGARRSSFAACNVPSCRGANRASTRMCFRNPVTAAGALVLSIDRWAKVLVPRRQQSFEITIALARRNFSAIGSR